VRIAEMGEEGGRRERERLIAETRRNAEIGAEKSEKKGPLAPLSLCAYLCASAVSFEL
jgi:hypothetical protein